MRAVMGRGDLPREEYAIFSDGSAPGGKRGGGRWGRRGEEIAFIRGLEGEKKEKGGGRYLRHAPRWRQQIEGRGGEAADLISSSRNSIKGRREEGEKGLTGEKPEPKAFDHSSYW